VIRPDHDPDNMGSACRECVFVSFEKMSFWESEFDMDLQQQHQQQQQ